MQSCLSASAEGARVMWKGFIMSLALLRIDLLSGSVVGSVWYGSTYFGGCFDLDAVAATSPDHGLPYPLELLQTPSRQ